MWNSYYVAISLLVVALTTVDIVESRRSFGGRRPNAGVYKTPTSFQHANPVHLSYGDGHATAPKPAQAGGSHAYPSSGGLSGSSAGGGSNGYPSSGGLSGSNTGGGSHGYPSSNGLSGTNTGNYGASNVQNTHVNPINSAYPTNSHGYPSNGGLSGNNNNHGYPASNGMSGHGSNNQPPPYSPSSQYPNSQYQPNYHVNGVNSAPNGGHPMPYPPYQGPPPMYVQQVQSSGSRFGDILTGLAIYNLAQTAANKFSSSKHNPTDNANGKSNSTTTADMACVLKIIGENKTETVKVPCDIVSSFITVNSSVANSTIATTSNATTVTNVTTADNKTNSVLTNSTDLVNGASVGANTTSTASVESNSSITNMSTTTEGAVTQNVSGLIESTSVVTNNSTDVPNDPNKAENTTQQPTVITKNEGSEATTPMTVPDAIDNTTITVPQTIMQNQNSSDGNITDTVATSILPTNAATVLAKNETTVSPTTMKSHANSSNIQNAVDPIAVKGPSIEVKPDYECVIEVHKKKTTTTSNKVPCALLLQYAFQGSTTTVRPAPRASPNGSPRFVAFANSGELSAICLVLSWVKYYFI